MMYLIIGARPVFIILYNNKISKAQIVDPTWEAVRHHQVKGSLAEGLAGGVSSAHHWVWTQEPFWWSQTSQKGLYQWALTPGARPVPWVRLITTMDYDYSVHHLNCMQCWIHGTAKAFAHKFPTIIIHNILVTSLQNITSCLLIMFPLECLYKFPTCIACNFWW
jgi:hypothetical protein